MIGANQAVLIGLLRDSGGGTYTAKSVVLDISDNLGAASFLGLRAVDFILGVDKIINLATTNFLAYATDEFSVQSLAAFAFDTSLIKTGPWQDRSWLTAANNSMRLICVFNNETSFDDIIINNYHNSGNQPDIGSENVKIYITPDTYTNTTFEAAVTNSTLIYDSVFRIHTSVDEEDPETLSLIAP